MTNPFTAKHKHVYTNTDFKADDWKRNAYRTANVICNYYLISTSGYQVG